MTDVLRDFGSGMSWTPELLLRQVLLEGVLALAGDEFRMAEMVQRADTLDQSSRAQWERDFRDTIADLAEHGPGKAPLRIKLGYPHEQAVYPHVSIVLASGSEDRAQATVGDRLGQTTEHRGTPTEDDPSASRAIEHTLIGLGWTTTLEIGVWAVAPEQAILIHALLKHLILYEKGRMVAAGVTEMSISETGFTPGEGWGRVGFVPVIRCTMAWTIQSTLRKGPVPTRVTLRRVRGGA